MYIFGPTCSGTEVDFRDAAPLVTGAEDPFTIAPVQLEAPRANEVLVRVVGAGICHTDIVLKGGLAPFPLPAVLGHEGQEGLRVFAEKRLPDWVE